MTLAKYLLIPFQYHLLLEEVIVIESLEDVRHTAHQLRVLLPHQNLKRPQELPLGSFVVMNKLNKHRQGDKMQMKRISRYTPVNMQF